jgi:hypothetical protein
VRKDIGDSLAIMPVSAIAPEKCPRFDHPGAASSRRQLPFDLFFCAAQGQ